MMNEPSALVGSPMSSSRIKRFARSYFPSFVCGILAIALSAGSMGFPLSLEPENTSSTPFPCQGHHCGCRSAENCWHHCCCFTLEQRLAWAATHHVTPPIALAVNAQQAPTKKRSCCEHEHGCNDSDDESTQDVISLRAPRCHGIAMLWLSHGPMAPETIEIRWTFDWVLVGFVDSPYVMTSDVCQLPAVPPPRHVSDAA